MHPKLIIALDFHRQEEALTLVNQLNPTQCALKVGSEMFTLFGVNFIHQLIQKEFKIFLDLKFHDIPSTVARACKACAELGVWMINVHASGGLAMMQAAREALTSYGSKRPLLIAVTILTSINPSDLSQIGIDHSLEGQVQKLARLAYQAELDGVVCSAHEVAVIKETCGNSFLTVTPGIRLPDSKKDDQSRTVTPSQAIALGSDYLVVGRPITGSSDPVKIVNAINTSINL
ncbi:orotidine-5'-phosphate decarboxylase [Legionella jamestowniensis]|uniref:Orotidine 5'-phosphate decarboxylase n=1 Tax=Legionella jamestowniensis TaxID=455 RepID=A0A0W0UU75_9GAMM|nr:orotidine-5'-phosphate decarboxylase [Legionella jamestowniensis]KTD11413.1 orotidine 5`-phosphate decarboxylase [Legionella jamestowniensis]OCH98733.1 orotidine 5'-phosphate decarboxylase [Legionella jamestowniensis]SFL67671.1 orotidine-5'-phosphate decarboxylase [Legionella jamestowniensis DSM 19215]